MFNNASSFNQDISTWNTSKVTDMSDMFYGATSFNQNILLWNTSNVVNMGNMFRQTPFLQDLHTWNVSKVTSADYIFCNCPGMLAAPAYRPVFTIPYISSCS
jgi:surface protein